MKYREQYRYDALLRTVDVIENHDELSALVKDSAAHHQLKSSVSAVAAQVHAQEVARNALIAYRTRQAAASQELKVVFMTPAKKFARAKLTGVPDFSAIVRSPGNLSDKQLVRAARASATALAPHADLLVAGGLPAEFVSGMEAAAAAVEDAWLGRANAKVAIAGATKAITNNLDSGREAVQMLEAVLAKKLASDSALAAEWRRATRITSKPGVARGGDSSAPAETPAPAATQAPATPALPQAA